MFFVCKTLPFVMGLIFVTQFIMTWEFMIEIQSWHINKLVHTDNYNYSVLLRHEVKVFSFSLAFLSAGNLYLSSRRLNINKAVHLSYISYIGMRETCGYSFWRICTSCLQLKKRHQERFSWLLEQWSTLQHSKVTRRPLYAWGYVLISRIDGFKCNFSVRRQFET